MSATQKDDLLDLLSLHEDLLINISSWLDHRDVWMMELARKSFYNVSSRPRGPCGRELILPPSEAEPNTPELFRSPYSLDLSVMVQCCSLYIRKLSLIISTMETRHQDVLQVAS